MNKVENLKKVTLNFQAGAAPDQMDLTPKNPGFCFIFGLAPEGMTPFEYELVDKVVDDDVLLHLTRDNFDKLFEHLNPPLWDLFDGGNGIYLRAKIVEIAAADNREIVKAMADMTAHGGTGCDCGCGCG